MGHFSNFLLLDPRLVKQKEVPNYDPSQYRSERVQVKAHDGATVPVSLVFHKDAVELDPATGKPKAPAPMHLYGYGSYGICIDPDFSYRRLPMLNRGMVFAVAHIRGGVSQGGVALFVCFSFFSLFPLRT